MRTVDCLTWLIAVLQQGEGKSIRLHANDLKRADGKALAVIPEGDGEFILKVVAK